MPQHRTRGRVRPLLEQGAAGGRVRSSRLHTLQGTYAGVIRWRSRSAGDLCRGHMQETYAGVIRRVICRGHMQGTYAGVIRRRSSSAGDLWRGNSGKFKKSIGFKGTLGNGVGKGNPVQGAGKKYEDPGGEGRNTAHRMYLDIYHL